MRYEVCYPFALKHGGLAGEPPRVHHASRRRGGRVAKILSGRTKDQNIGHIAQYLTALGIDLKEVRVVGDEERAIVDALNALRHRCTYVFTTGGIGPNHGDITTSCVAKAFGVTTAVFYARAARPIGSK
jgi:molybdopterin-biosynthesis enzyme MoeA-like protein